MRRSQLMSVDDVKYQILHCSATRRNQDYTEEMLLRDHLARHFRGIGYHFYVRKDGKMSQHRKILEVGAHCVPYNRCSIGICYEGGLDENGLKIFSCSLMANCAIAHNAGQGVSTPRVADAAKIPRLLEYNYEPVDRQDKSF